ncbi:MAG: alanine--tRNA ligase [Rhodothermales bacterium]|nr:alanine--tRNA ligase [Rhodothermales bacterium]
MPEVKTSDSIRKEFFDFFVERGHQLVPSDSLVPSDDPTLLFTNAGMNQFKDVFLETGTRPYTRAVDTQKCLRVSGKHNDLEEVGLDTYHHTFFEMLGNWSFGDYFKREAIRWAWELLVDKWQLDADRLYATVHAGDADLGLDPDDEAAELWRSETGINHDNILFCSSKDNFWMMGDTGPCGPCSEIHIDLRSDEERQEIPGSSLVNADDPRVMEIWNLVFIQYNALGDSGLEPLSAQHVDTGMGFERIVAVLQGKTSNYDTDLFMPLLQAIADSSPNKLVTGYDSIETSAEERESLRIAMRVIADHVRTVGFAIADGAIPGNVGRGYVIRRILRRAVRFGYQRLGFRQPFMHELIDVLVTIMGHVFPNIVESRDYIVRVVRSEEESFLETLGTGIAFFEHLLPHIRSAKSKAQKAVTALEADRQTMDLLTKAYAFSPSDESVAVQFVADADGGHVPGPVAFLLHDTYGFPVDLTELMAREVGLDIDIEGYQSLMELQKQRARTAANFAAATGDGADWVVQSTGETRFVGFDTLTSEGKIVQYSSSEDEEGNSVIRLVFDSTPFYAESGGQVGDTGIIVIGGEEIEVIDTVKDGSKYVHIVREMPVDLDAIATLTVDSERRARTAKHHTATHLLHAALREVLGPHVTQKGSLVAPDRLRFDFNHFERVGDSDLDSISRQVNESIQQNIKRQEERDVAFDDAIARGATALFGEKYGDKVRMITFDPNYSVELCGGTHVDATGEIGIFQFIGEGSVAAGIRRVEAVTGLDAVSMIGLKIAELDKARSVLKSQSSSIDEEIEHLLSRQKQLQKEVAELRAARHESAVKDALADAAVIDGVRFAAVRLNDVEMDVLRDLGTRIRPQMTPDSVAILGGRSPEGDKAYLVAIVSDDLKGRISAGSFVGQVARGIDGGGGGRPELATAGGNSPEKLDDALSGAASILSEMLQPTD